MRSGNSEKGLSASEAGLSGLRDWLDDVNQNAAFSFGQYWDPMNEIRAEIHNSLGMISRRDIDRKS